MRTRKVCRVGISIVGFVAWASTAGAAERCANRVEERQALFGELHVHTAISMDANLFGTRLRPDDAYRFARGMPVQLADLGPGVPGRTVKLDRPLDFAAVTDHALNFGSVHLCTTPGSEAYESDACSGYRRPIDLSGNTELRSVIRELTGRLGAELGGTAVCGDDGGRCRAASVTVWEETKAAAERWNDTSDDCAFTSFIAYEYTATPELTKIHRNVIFRGSTVLEAPISYVEEPSAIRLWERLRDECTLAGNGCDVLAIPHNSNLSNGHMFAVEYGDAKTVAEQAAVAKLRASMEPVVEMMQMKGDSECRNGMWNVVGGADELCDFEKMRPAETEDCEDGTGKGALGGEGCVSRLDYARYALIEGLREADRLGVNPYAFGMIAATDGHDGVPGPVEEHRLDLRIGTPSGSPGMNLGGLAGVWAEENSRDSIFQAMRRRETFGTSGPRMQVRFFGGWDYPADLCSQLDLVAKGYAGGVPMGGDLPARAEGTGAPVFAISATRDPGTEAHPGGLLQRIQIVKGTYDADGKFRQQIVDVAGYPAGRAMVDTKTCEPSGVGHDALCGVWSDPDFDPKSRAVYYARVVENPSCRTNGWACATAPAERRPAFCDAEDSAPLTVQERAWSSPIWWSGESSGDG